LEQVAQMPFQGQREIVVAPTAKRIVLMCLMGRLLAASKRARENRRPARMKTA
jgi:hypothetical protein